MLLTGLRGVGKTVFDEFMKRAIPIFEK